ncbi:hypothetical protein [Prosthecobacter sp.]|uniref:hypothetical protein n=1 Tax=Prosthecobacter sp. TaxID=1965333 RepID=UPI002AB9B4FF|nr:hypothetical protein [Prosthecobacter sp.]MDZ4403777.1 hypothetical protein [Prosthecobacter sp.]
MMQADTADYAADQSLKGRSTGSRKALRMDSMLSLRQAPGMVGRELDFFAMGGEGSDFGGDEIVFRPVKPPAHRHRINLL